MQTNHWVHAKQHFKEHQAEIDKLKGDIQKLMNQVNATLEEDKQAALWRQVGDLMFDRYVSIPLFYLPAEVVVNPKIVGDWVFPGDITGARGRSQAIQAAADFKGRSLWQDALRRLLANKAAMVSLVVLAIITSAEFFAAAISAGFMSFSR